MSNYFKRSYYYPRANAWGTSALRKIGVPRRFYFASRGSTPSVSAGLNLLVIPFRYTDRIVPGKCHFVAVVFEITGVYHQKIRVR